MDRPRTPPERRMGKRKMPLATRRGLCRNRLHRWKSFFATLSKVGRIPRWLSRWASAGSSAAWADKGDKVEAGLGSPQPPPLSSRQWTGGGWAILLGRLTGREDVVCSGD